VVLEELIASQIYMAEVVVELLLLVKVQIQQPLLQVETEVMALQPTRLI
jgi:hypothetical protein